VRRGAETWGSRSPFAEHAISVSSRRRRVSSRFALTTHQVATFRYPGGCAFQNDQASAFARKTRWSALGSATSVCSNEYAF
jgi:hypothetical protein